MPQSSRSADLLGGALVLDAAGEPAAMAGRILADLGAEVVKVGDPLEDPRRRRAWDRGCRRVPVEEAVALLPRAAVVIETPGWPGVGALDRSVAPRAVWVAVTPFGLDGPRASWRASDLGVMAASGNMHATGDADRPPVRPSQPAAYAHVGPEVALAVLTALASGRPQDVDVSMQEVVCVASMCAPARLVRSGEHMHRRGANIGRTREIWPCADGWVSFGLRGGKARVASLETLTRLCIDDGVPGAEVLAAADWASWSHTEASDDDLAAIQGPVAAYFARHTVAELYEIACETNLMLAPANSPREIYASAQLAARDFFDADGAPRSFYCVELGRETLPGDPANNQEQKREGGAWAGTRIVEFGSGAAGPIATRYFVEHGATVVRVESRSRPDFLRVYALGPGNPHGLEGSVLFDGMNVGKRSVTLDLKHPDGVEAAKRLIAWADAVCENFAPKAMAGFGLDYATLAPEIPGLVMVSSCLNGQTGPHRDYPGFGGQGAALSGWNFLTGWPDREPLGPFGTITDSLAPRFVATALAAGLLHRRRTGRGAHLDVSQVESAIFTLSPWLLDFHERGVVTGRSGNAHPHALLHGAYPCAGDDRWVAVACWTGDDLDRLASVVGGRDNDAVSVWASSRTPLECAEALQAAGVEAVPVQDFADLLADPQLAHRGHFVTLDHPVMGPGPYERNGFRLSGSPGGYDAPSPLLGEHTLPVLGGLVGLTERELNALQRSGALD
jgi:crotonobetainyl-CoA:carnitine CoA-transferase CaiB-like acyl-CoA transferase